MKRILTAMALLGSLAWGTAQAHDFSVKMDGNVIYFAITDSASRTAEVTYKGKIADHAVPEVKGTVEIPDQVSHKKVVYTITGIGPKAFKGAKELQEVKMPATVTSVGMFAFEDCESLKRIEVGCTELQFDESSFFKCPEFQTIDFAEGMTDLSKFDMSSFHPDLNDIQKLRIPASATSIPEYLPETLRAIDVAAGNKNFYSFEGAFYENGGTVLSFVPRGRRFLKVKEGVTEVKPGALRDCQALEKLLFPSSLQKVSVTDLEPLIGLRALGFKGSEPPATVNNGDTPWFLLTCPSFGGTQNRKCAVLVDKENYDTYRDALVTKEQLLENTTYLEDPTRMKNGRAVIVQVNADNLVSPTMVQATDLETVFATPSTKLKTLKMK